jgi:hypothetical protein
MALVNALCGQVLVKALNMHIYVDIYYKNSKKKKKRLIMSAILKKKKKKKKTYQITIELNIKLTLWGCDRLI